MSILDDVSLDYIRRPDGVVAQVAIRDENFLPVSKEISDKICDDDRDVIAGWGERTNDTCGTPVGTFFSGAEWKFIREHCMAPDCPVCFRSWAAMRGDVAAGTLWRMYETGWVGRLYHVAISWDPHRPFPGWAKFIELAKAFLQSFHRAPHELGFTIVRHLTRIRCVGCGTSPAERGSKGSHLKPCGCGKSGRTYVMNEPPEGIVVDEEGSFEYAGYELYEAQHLHLVTNFRVHKKDFKALREAEVEYGFKFVNISQDGRKSGGPGYIDSWEALSGILSYELGHAIVGGHAIRYFGLFNPKRWERAQDVDPWRTEIVLDAFGQPFRKVRGKFLSNTEFLPDEKLYPEGEPEYLVVKHWWPKLRLGCDANGKPYTYPEDGHDWVPLGRRCSPEEVDVPLSPPVIDDEVEAERRAEARDNRERERYYEEVLSQGISYNPESLPRMWEEHRRAKLQGARL